MKELRFSFCNELPDIREVLKPFNQNRPPTAQVQLHLMPWDNYKQELTTMALYRQGADVSQVGGPLVNDLVAMKALQPFTHRDIDLLGGVSAFSKAAWGNSLRTSEGLVYALPWIIDPRAIVYWRDVLEKAHVDESKAFKSFDQMEETLRRIQAGGVKSPWIFQMDKLVEFQTACTWIWGAGGDIGNEKELLILHPKALEGLRNYFNLSRFMSITEPQPDAVPTCIETFTQQRAAVTVCNLSNYRLIKQNLPPEMQENLGVAMAPGPLFLGSSSLVVWQNAQDDSDAINLVQYLLGEEAQRNYCLRAGFLPTRLEVLNDAPFSTDPVLKVFAQSADNGRSIANLKLSGLLEDLLSTAIGHIWRKVIANPDIDLDAAIREEFEPVIRRASLWGE